MGKTQKPKRKNYVLGSTGLMRYSASSAFGRKQRYRWAKPGQKKAEPAPPQPKMIKKEIGGEKNGKFRMVPAKKMSKSYETQVLPKRIPTRKHVFSEQTHRLRKSITPGTILILVAGPHKGKHVVFLKQLGTGLLLVTGPFVLNGCPLRRIEQRYVIATKTKIDISGVTIPDRVNDEYFKRKREKRTKPADGEIFDKKKEKYVASPERKEDQVAVDKQIIAAIKKRDDKKLMWGYLKLDFKLMNHMYPHKMIF